MKVTTVYDRIDGSKKRIIVNVGGAGSSKSYSTAQWLIIERFIKPNHRILVTRKTTPSLRLSCYLLIKDILSQLGIPYEENRSEMTISYGTSLMVFKGLDDPTKVRSFNVDTIWAEEATELQYDDFSHLNLILRWERSKSPKKFLLTLNPISEQHWIKAKLVDSNRQDVDVFYSNWKDNPFLSEEYIAELKALKEQDINFYNIYALGKWGALEHRIFTNFDYRVLTGEPDNLYYGLDFGFNNPTALIEIAVKDQELYLT